MKEPKQKRIPVKGEEGADGENTGREVRTRRKILIKVEEGKDGKEEDGDSDLDDVGYKEVQEEKWR